MKLSIVTNSYIGYFAANALLANDILGQLEIEVVDRSYASNSEYLFVLGRESHHNIQKHDSVPFSLTLGTQISNSRGGFFLSNSRYGISAFGLPFHQLAAECAHGIFDQYQGTSIGAVLSLNNVSIRNIVNLERKLKTPLFEAVYRDRDLKTFFKNRYASLAAGSTTKKTADLILDTTIDFSCIEVKEGQCSNSTHSMIAVSQGSSTTTKLRAGRQEQIQHSNLAGGSSAYIPESSADLALSSCSEVFSSLMHTSIAHKMISQECKELSSLLSTQINHNQLVMKKYTKFGADITQKACEFINACNTILGTEDYSITNQLRMQTFLNNGYISPYENDFLPPEKWAALFIAAGERPSPSGKLSQRDRARALTLIKRHQAFIKQLITQFNM